MTHAAVKTRTAQTPWFRTLWQGFGIDALVLIGLGVGALMTEGIDPTTPVFWMGLGALVLKSVLTAFASYLVRLKVDPQLSEPDVE